MTPSGIKARILERELRRVGFVRLPRRGKGSHRRYEHPDGRHVTVSDAGGMVSPGVVNEILRVAPEIRSLL